jgi:Taurine catabolism dioxygenase TauD, TfdA family
MLRLWRYAVPQSGASPMDAGAEGCCMVTSFKQGWLAQDLATYLDWRIRYRADLPAVAEDVEKQLKDGPGLALVTGVPVEQMNIDRACGLAVELMSHLGKPLLQGPENEAQLSWLVRNEGAELFNADGSYARGSYSSRSAADIDLHNDAAMRPHGHDLDYFGLLCLGAAARGGETTLVSSLAVHAVLRRECPSQLDRRYRPFAFERSHVVARGEESVIRQPVFSVEDGRLRVRCNRQRIEMAAELTGVPVGDDGVAALNAMENVASRRDLQFRFRLASGDFLIADDHLVLHGRDSFADDRDGGRRRCLVRVVLSRR